MPPVVKVRIQDAWQSAPVAGTVTVTIAQPSSDGQTVAGVLPVSVATAGSAVVTKVELFWDGGAFGLIKIGETTTPTTFGWIIDWNTTTFTNGAYSLIAKAHHAGTTTSSSPRSALVANSSTGTMTEAEIVRRVKECVAFGGSYQNQEQFWSRWGRKTHGLKFAGAGNGTWDLLVSATNNWISQTPTDRLLIVTPRLLVGHVVGGTGDNFQPNYVKLLAGNYNEYFDAIGDELNKLSLAQLQHLILRLGHEFNGTWYVQCINFDANGLGSFEGAGYASANGHSPTRREDFGKSFAHASNRMRLRIFDKDGVSAAVRRAALRFDFNVSGGSLSLAMESMRDAGKGAKLFDTTSDVDSRMLDVNVPLLHCSPDIISYDAYCQDNHRKDLNGAPLTVGGSVPSQWSQGPELWVTEMARRYGAQCAMSEGSPVSWMVKNGVQIACDNPNSPIFTRLINDANAWLRQRVQEVTPSGRQFVSHYMLYERDPPGEKGLRAAIIGQSSTDEVPHPSGLANNENLTLWPGAPIASNTAVGVTTGGVHVHALKPADSFTPYEAGFPPTDRRFMKFRAFNGYVGQPGQPPGFVPTRSATPNAQTDFPAGADQMLDLWGGP